MARPDTIVALQQFIPLQNGQDWMIKDLNLINDLLGQVGYTVRDGYVVFTEDITDPGGLNLNAVDMQLVVMDIGKYGDYDILPLPADMVEDVIMAVVAQLTQTPPADKVVDPVTEQSPDKR